MYKLKLSALLDPDLMKNCMWIIEDLKEKRCREVLEQQRLKFERLKLQNTVNNTVAIAAKINSKVVT